MQKPRSPIQHTSFYAVLRSACRPHPIHHKHNVISISVQLPSTWFVVQRVKKWKSFIYQMLVCVAVFPVNPPMTVPPLAPPLHQGIHLAAAPVGIFCLHRMVRAKVGALRWVLLAALNQCVAHPSKRYLYATRFAYYHLIRVAAFVACIPTPFRAHSPNTCRTSNSNRSACAQRCLMSIHRS